MTPAAKPAIPPQAQVTQSPNPVANPFAALLGKPSSSTGTLSPEQRAIVDRVNGYLAGVQALTGKFIQVGPDGSRTQGDFSSRSLAACASNMMIRVPSN